MNVNKRLPWSSKLISNFSQDMFCSHLLRQFYEKDDKMKATKVNKIFSTALWPSTSKGVLRKFDNIS